MKHLESIWETSNGAVRYNSLAEDINCEVLVVGGGIVGLLCAYTLVERGYEVVLAEAERIMGGVTKNTTATITSQHGEIYDDIAAKYGLEAAKLFYDSQEEGISLYEKLIASRRIDCNFSRLNGYFFTLNSDVKTLKSEYEVLNKIGARAEYITEIEGFPLPVGGAIKQEGQAQFDPLMFLSALPVNYRIYENTRIIDLNFKEGIARTENASIKAAKIVIATHFPIYYLPGLPFVKMYQSVSYASAFENVGNVDGIYNDDKDDGITLRNYHNMLIVNGCDHRSGRKSTDAFDKLEKAAKSLYPNCRKVADWLSEDCVTYDSIPFAGRIKNNDNRNFVITGFNKWGMSNSIICANLIADLIEGKPNRYSRLFSPHRKYIAKNLGSFIKGAAISAANLFKSFLTFPLCAVKNLKKDSAGIFLIKGKKRAVYRDSDGVLHIIKARCPHLGCQLAFNTESGLWECPCHGSRFDVDGKIVTEPAIKRPL